MTNYINKIDLLVDSTIDIFYDDLTKNTLFVDKILKDVNFVKYQKDINKILVDASKNINLDEINEIVGNFDNAEIILNIIKKYVTYYLFLTISFFYAGKKEMFFNNVIEFSKNQSSFPYKVKDFFNSESNNTIIKFSNIISNLIIILKSSSKVQETILNNPDNKYTANFIDKIGMDILNTAAKLENLNGDVKKQSHNIIKTLIVIEMYVGTDKNIIFNILEEQFKTSSNYQYIQVVMPKAEYVDYGIIESILSPKQQKRGMVDEIFNMIVDYDNTDKYIETSINKKIQDLIYYKVFIPITEDFLLFHKDNEKYEKITFTKTKNQDTKLRYIVSKIDGVADLYSQSTQKNAVLKKDTESLFSITLENQRAILINNFEDLSIIKKTEDLGRVISENEEFLNDLLTFRQYPYINFKAFKESGFVLPMTFTTNAIRNLSFNYEIKNINDKPLQLRVGTDKQNLHMVGLAIPANNTLLHCMTTGNMTNIKNIKFVDKSGNSKTYSHGYDALIQFLNSTIGKNRTNKQVASKIPSVYWLFDENTDKLVLDKYIQTDVSSPGENLKILVSRVYDQMHLIIYSKIKKYLSSIEAIDIYTFKKLLETVNKKLFMFPTSLKYYDKLNAYVTLKKTFKEKNQYDKKSDIIRGISGSVVKLIRLPKVEAEKGIIKINVEDYDKIIKGVSDDYKKSGLYGAICQHNITWDEISRMKKGRSIKFDEALHDFLYKFVVINAENNYVCKSCGSLINIKQYVMDGAYDEDKGFNIFATILKTPLEEMVEYEKYSNSILNIEKIIDRIANILDIGMLASKSKARNPTKMRITKDCIDIIIPHSKNLKYTYESRKANLFTNYGVDPNLTSLFGFEFDNSIFVYSSKDKDKYKNIKRNNIIVYLLILIILEFSEHQILQLLNVDKICNFIMYYKGGYKLFDNLKIISNSNKVIKPIKNYPVLCYLLYMLSCVVTKFNMWLVDESPSTTLPTEAEKVAAKATAKKYNVAIQKLVINTFVDLLNSILEINYSEEGQIFINETITAGGQEDKKLTIKKKRRFTLHRIYNTIATKFLLKISTLYDDKVLYAKIHKMFGPKEQVALSNRKEAPVIPIPDVFVQHHHAGLNNWKAPKAAKFIPLPKQYSLINVTNINHFTNCDNETSSYHEWSVVGDKLVCGICKIELDTIKTNPNVDKKIQHKYVYGIMKSTIDKYCVHKNKTSGLNTIMLHNFVYDSKTGSNKCSLCGFVLESKLSDDEVNKMYQIFMNIQKDNETVVRKNITLIDNHIQDIDKNQSAIIKKLKEQYKQNTNNRENEFVNKFIDRLEGIVGKTIIIGDKSFYLKQDLYIIDHDHTGSKLDTPLVISSDDNKIFVKKDHPYFKTDVVYYVNNKLQIEVYYNKYNMLLLGYREKNKNYIDISGKIAYLKVEYSIQHKLSTLGYDYHTVSLKKYEDMRTQFENSDTFIEYIIADVSRQRINTLKKILANISRFVYKIKYDYENKTTQKLLTNYAGTVYVQDKSSNEDKFIKMHKPKLTKDIKLVDKQNKNKFFDNWKLINSGLNYKFEKEKAINIDASGKEQEIDVEKIKQYDSSGNIILLYIVNEFNKLLNYNDNNFMQNNVANFITEMINLLYSSYSQESVLTNFNLKKFKYILNSKSYVYTDNLVEITGQTTGIYDEYVDPDGKVDKAVIRELEDDTEMYESIDIDGKIDYEVDYSQ